jgi:CBS domain containing-hemolysin-like protein
VSASLSIFFGLCLVVSFLYAGIEAGLLSASRVRLRSRVHQGDRAAVRLDRLLAHPERLLATVLFVTNFADVAALVIITNAMVDHFHRWGYLITGVLTLPVYLLGLQLLPKSLFRRFPYRALSALAGLLELTSKVLAPLLVAVEWVVWIGRERPVTVGTGIRTPSARDGDAGTDPVLVQTDDERHHMGLFVAREEFKSLAAEGERTGALTGTERGMIHNVVDFGTLRVRELMLPAPESLAMREGLRVRDLLDFARTHAVEHLPVVKAAGELAALVDVYALLLDRAPDRLAAVTYLRRPPLSVNPGDAAHRVLRRLRSARLTAAAVVEDNRLIGIVRTKDLLQRLVRHAA